MIQFLVKAVYVLAEVVKMARALVKIVVEIKEARARVVETLKQAEPAKSPTESKAKSHTSFLHYPECEEVAYAHSMFFGPSEPDYIL
jgi:hypothetical protein